MIFQVGLSFQEVPHSLPSNVATGNEFQMRFTCLRVATVATQPLNIGPESMKSIKIIHTHTEPRTWHAKNRYFKFQKIDKKQQKRQN